MHLVDQRLKKKKKSNNPLAHAGDGVLIPGLGRSLGEGNDIPLQYSCLENPTDRGDLWARVPGIAKSHTRLTERFNNNIVIIILSIIPKKYKKVKVSQSCPTLCDPMDNTVHGILQARRLEWVAFSLSRVNVNYLKNMIML